MNSSEGTELEEIKENHHNLGRLTMEVLVEMIQSSPTNAGKKRYLDTCPKNDVILIVFVL